MVSEKIRKLLDMLTPSKPIKTDGEGKQYTVLKDRNSIPVRVSGKGLKLSRAEQGDIPAEGEERSPHEVTKTEVHFDLSKRQ